MNNRQREKMIERLYRAMPGSEFPKWWEGEPMDHPNWEFCEAIIDAIVDPAGCVLGKEQTK